MNLKYWPKLAWGWVEDKPVFLWYVCVCVVCFGFGFLKIYLFISWMSSHPLGWEGQTLQSDKVGLTPGPAIS